MVRGATSTRACADARVVRIQPYQDGYEMTLEWANHPGRSPLTFTQTGSAQPHSCGHDMGRQGLPGVNCPRAFHTRSQLRMHQKAVHQLKPFACQGCGKLILDGSNYDKHVSCCTHQPADLQVRRYSCDGCGQQSTRWDNMERHKRSCKLAGVPAAAPVAVAAAAVAPPLAPGPVDFPEHQEPPYVPEERQYVAATSDLPRAALFEDPAISSYEPHHASQMDGDLLPAQSGPQVDVAAGYGSVDFGMAPMPNPATAHYEASSPFQMEGEVLPAQSWPQASMPASSGFDPMDTNFLNVNWDLQAQGELQEGWDGNLEAGYPAALNTSFEAAPATALGPYGTPEGSHLPLADSSLEPPPFATVDPKKVFTPIREPEPPTSMLPGQDNRPYDFFDLALEHLADSQQPVCA